MSLSSRAVQAGPPHDGSMHALKPAGLPGLGWDPAPPSALWPCSPLFAAAATEASSQMLSGKPSHHISPSPSPGAPGPTSTPWTPGPWCAAHPQRGYPPGWAGGRHEDWGLLVPHTGSAAALPTLPRASQPPSQSWARGTQWTGVSQRRVHWGDPIQETWMEPPAGQRPHLKVGGKQGQLPRAPLRRQKPGRMRTVSLTCSLGPLLASSVPPGASPSGAPDNELPSPLCFSASIYVSLPPFPLPSLSSPVSTSTPLGTQRQGQDLLQPSLSRPNDLTSGPAVRRERESGDSHGHLSQTRQGPGRSPGTVVSLDIVSTSDNIQSHF